MDDLRASAPTTSTGGWLSDVLVLSDCQRLPESFAKSFTSVSLHVPSRTQIEFAKEFLIANPDFVSGSAAPASSPARAAVSSIDTAKINGTAVRHSMVTIQLFMLLSS